MYLLQGLRTQRVQRIVHILLHLLLLIVSFKVFLLLLLHPHLQQDGNDVFFSSSSSMDTLWQGILSYDNCNIDICSGLSSGFFSLFLWKFFRGLYSLWLSFLSFDCIILILYVSIYWSYSLSRAYMLVTLASSWMQSSHTMSNFILSFLSNRDYMNES